MFKSVKVLHLLYSNFFSGAENVVCQIISMMKEEDIEMAYCSRDGQIREALKEKNIEFYPIEKLNVNEVKRVISIYRPDIIHAHDMHASFIASLACGKIPIVSHIHNNAFDSRTINKKSIAYAVSAMKAKYIFWVSRSAFDGYRFHNWFKGKSRVLYNVIDINQLYEKMEMDTAKYGYDVIYMGRLTFQKNPQRLIKVIRLAIKRKPDLTVAIVGTGELEAETKKLVEEYGLENSIKFKGYQPNPLKMLHDSKVMLMTSRWEGTPMCVLEAMALGVPIVSTPTDGIKDLIHDGENGYLSDTDEELAARLVQIVEDKAERVRLSKKQIADATEYNRTDLYRDAIISVYSDILNNRK